MMSDFANSITNHIAKYATVTDVKTDKTPFRIIQAKEKNIAFHLIELNLRHRAFLRHTDRYFCSDLSSQFEGQGVQLVHIWEDVWQRRRELVELRSAALLGSFRRYHARKTTVKNISNSVLREFLQRHHLQAAIGGKYKYGLFENSELLAVASFSAVCPIHRNGKVYRSCELLRFASKMGCVVAGALGKLTAHFELQQRPDDIMTYADRDWGTGRGYCQLGFVKTEMLAPQPFMLDCENFERTTVKQAEHSNSAIVCYNSGSYKFLKYFC